MDFSDLNLAEFGAVVYFDNTLSTYATAAGIILASIIIGKIVYFIINRYLKKIFAKTKTKGLPKRKSAKESFESRVDSILD